MATPGPTIYLNDLSIPTLGGRTRNDARENPGKGIWTEYTKEVKEYDERMTNTWKEDADGILVFTGLFAATVGAFIIESYKTLSPDETVTLLGQISQQLVGFNNGTYPSPPASKPFSPSASMIWVNAMWLISLILSIASALFATLLQQWARRYAQIPRIPSESKDRARVRSFLFFGTRVYKTRFAVETVPTLLHISVFLFFAGLIIFFFTIHKMVAIIVSISVGFFALAYFALTVLPCIDHRCPYRTPMSNIWWYLWHASLALARGCLRWAVKLLHSFLISDNLGVVTSTIQGQLVNWLETGRRAVGKHQQCLKDGLEKTIVQGAKNAPADVDRRALTRLFNEFAKIDRGKLPKFLASIPREEMIELMTPPIDSGKIVFYEPLLTALRGCAIDARAIGLEEDARKRSLIVCLDAVHHVVKAFIGPNGVPLPEMRTLVDDIRSDFAAVSLMQKLWVDADSAVRITARSICALLARLLMRRDWFEAPELDWLHDVTGESRHTIFDSRMNFPELDRMNLKSFVYGVLSVQVDDLPTEQVLSFTETLVVLTNAGIPTALDENILRTRLVDLIGRMDTDGQHRNDIANKLRRMFLPALAPAPASTSTSAPAPVSTSAPAPASTSAPAAGPTSTPTQQP